MMPNDAGGGLDRETAVVVGDTDEAAAIAASLAADGANVVRIVREPVGGPYFEGETHRLAECGSLAKRIIKDFGEPRILVHAQERTVFGPFSELQLEDWNGLVATNLKSAFHSAQVFGGRMLRSGGGRVVLLSSTLASVGVSGTAAYAAMSGGIEQLVRTLGAEWSPRGVRVNGVAHWSAASRRVGILPPDPAWTEDRMPKIDAVTGAVRFLVSDSAAGLVGEILRIDGGYCAQ